MRKRGIYLDWLAGLPYPLRDALRRWRGLLGMVLGVGIALGIGMTILGASSASVDSFSASLRIGMSARVTFLEE